MNSARTGAPVQVIDDRAAYRLAATQQEVRLYESGFRLWNGNIDLMAMSERMPPEHFRRYITLTRAVRAMSLRPSTPMGKAMFTIIAAANGDAVAVEAGEVLNEDVVAPVLERHVVVADVELALADDDALAAGVDKRSSLELEEAW
ncbi:MAG: hypothetical protein ABSC05_24170 [Candidatus Solibacter sp.]